MAKKNGNSTEKYEFPVKTETVSGYGDAPEMAETIPAPEKAEEKSAESGARIWVYLGPSIRGVVTNGRIFRGTRAEVVKLLENGIETYPQIERLLVADKNVAKARNDLKAKRGIYIPYQALADKITGKEG